MRRYLLPLSALVVFAGMATSVSAQVPRARIAPEAWFRTVPTSSSLLGTYHWIDLSGDSVTTVSRNRNNPTLVNTNALPFPDTHSINFHPALRFSGSIFQKELALSYSSLAQGTIIGIFAPIAATSSSDAALFGLKGRNGEETLVGRIRYIMPAVGHTLTMAKHRERTCFMALPRKKPNQNFWNVSPGLFPICGLTGLYIPCGVSRNTR